MSKEQFELKKAVIEAIPDADVSTPNMPVAIAVQEAEDLLEWCLPDKEVLIRAGFDWSLVDDLPARIGACRYAQSLWQKEFKALKTPRKNGTCCRLLLTTCAIPWCITFYMLTVKCPT